MPRFPLVGKTPSKFSNIYICALGIHSNLYAHIKGGSLYSSNLVNLFIPYSEIFKKNE